MTGFKMNSLSLKQKIQYLIGKLSKSYRLKFHKKHNNKWLWGIYQFINDFNKGDTHELANDQ